MRIGDHVPLETFPLTGPAETDHPYAVERAIAWFARHGMADPDGAVALLPTDPHSPYATHAPACDRHEEMGCTRVKNKHVVNAKT